MNTDWLQGVLFGFSLACLCALPIINSLRPKR
jgi:hypothetical protein